MSHHDWGKWQLNYFSYLKKFDWGGLSYVSEELACHAIETYTERLSQPEENEKLKVHCYRAVLEHLLVTTRSAKYRHTILKTVSKAHNLSFPEYVGRATQKLVAESGLQPFTDEELTCPEVVKRLSRLDSLLNIYFSWWHFQVVGGGYILHLKTCNGARYWDCHPTGQVTISPPRKQWYRLYIHSILGSCSSTKMVTTA